jgi:putative endonuclease
LKQVIVAKQDALRSLGVAGLVAGRTPLGAALRASQDLKQVIVAKQGCSPGGLISALRLPLCTTSTSLHYVYLLESQESPSERYVGVTSDLRTRLVEHNSGKSPHTSKHRPWKVVTYVAFSERLQAEAFETYLKSGSGHAFARKRLWPI